MTIPTQLSLQGVIATIPELTFTAQGHARFYSRVGIDQFRKEVDGAFTKLEPVFCDLVLFDRTAERAYARFKSGDQIVASGYVHEYEQERPGAGPQLREQFVARRIGHDATRTRYTVDRTQPVQPAAPNSETTMIGTPAPAVGI